MSSLTCRKLGTITSTDLRRKLFPIVGFLNGHIKVTARFGTEISLDKMKEKKKVEEEIEAVLRLQKQIDAMS